MSQERTALLEQERLQNEIELRNQKILSRSLHQSEKNQVLEDIIQSLSVSPQLVENGTLSKDIKALKEIIQNPSSDLFAKIPWGTGQTIMREALQIIDHASYHIGQLVVLRKALGAWKNN